jgi:hypothetical protein
MSLSQRTDVFDTSNEDANESRRGYGFILALLCMAVTLALASAILTPVSIGSGVSSDISIVGP